MLVLDGHTSAVYALAFSPDGDRLASGDRTGNVLLWAGGGQHRLSAVEPAGAATVNGLAFAPTGVALVEATSVGLVTAPLPNEYAGLARGPRAASYGVTGVAFAGRHHVAIGYGNRAKPEGGSLKLHQPLGNARESEFPAPKGVRSVAAAGGVVAWSEWGRVVYVWDIRKPDRLKWPLAAEVPCVALAPDGTQLAAGVDYKVKLYDVAGKRERLSLDGHTGRVTGVAFTPDGGTVVSGSWDGTVRLWDATSGNQRAAFQWPVGKVTSLAVSPDGLRLAVGGDAGAVVVADLD